MFNLLMYAFMQNKPICGQKDLLLQTFPDNNYAPKGSFGGLFWSHN